MTNAIYHIYNRGTDKRKIFLDDKDYLRFIHDLFEFNDEDNVFNVGHCFDKYIDVKRQYIRGEAKPRKMLVDILAFCLMPNHYHFLIQPRKEKGVPEFMKKINGGYAKYFNARHERSGRLFQGTYKSVLVSNESHFIHLPFYIHLNPLDLAAPEWRKRQINDFKKAINFLESYRWSSYLDYIGERNFPSVTNRKLLSEFFDGSENYKKETEKWLKDMDLEQINDLILEKD